MPVTNMAQTMWFLLPPHRHIPTTKQTLAGEAQRLLSSLDTSVLSTGHPHMVTLGHFHIRTVLLDEVCC